MPTTTLKNILEITGNKAIDEMNSDGSLPAGQNGPHGDPETPVRNTSHYLFLFSRLYEETGEEKYSDAAKKAGKYLISDKSRPHGHTFHHRNSKNKDKCNGLIGQAWTIEALANAATVLDNKKMRNVAEDVFMSHQFDERLGIWKRTEIDGTILCFDSTFNHQLWFAAAGGILATHHDVDPKVDQRVRQFLNKIEKISKVNKDGSFAITVEPPYHDYPYIALTDNKARLLIILLATKMPLKNSQVVRKFVQKFTPISRLPSKSDEMKNKIYGYQSFHLYGLGILKENYPDHSVWESDWIKKSLNYSDSMEYKKALEKNRYGYKYNVSGIELAYVWDIFGNESDVKKQKYWLKNQFNHCYNWESKRMERNNSDPETLTARIYEAARLSNWELEIDIQ